MGLKWAMETFMGTKTVAQLRAEEHNEQAMGGMGGYKSYTQEDPLPMRGDNLASDCWLTSPVFPNA